MSSRIVGNNPDTSTPCPTCGKTIGLPDKLYIAGTICPNPIGHQALAEAPATQDDYKRCGYCGEDFNTHTALLEHARATHATQAQPKTDESKQLLRIVVDLAPGEAVEAIQRLITEARREELNDLVIGKPAIGPNGEDLGVNTIDHDAIWRRINDRLAELKRSL